MKAMEKDRARRYETPTGLAEDVRRYLDGSPVHAAPPSPLYRAQKLVKKHKRSVIAIAASATLLCAGLLGTSSQMLRARRAERIAIDQQENASSALRSAALALGQAANIPNHVIVTIPDPSAKRSNWFTCIDWINPEADGSPTIYGAHVDPGATFPDRSTREAASTTGNTTALSWVLSTSIDELNRTHVELLKEKNSAELEAYIANLALAQAAMDNDNWPEARTRLAACPESKRGWEWNMLSLWANEVLTAIPKSGAKPLRFSQDDKQLALSRGGEFAIFDLSSNKLIDPSPPSRYHNSTTPSDASSNFKYLLIPQDDGSRFNIIESETARVCASFSGAVGGYSFEAGHFSSTSDGVQFLTRHGITTLKPDGTIAAADQFPFVPINCDGWWVGPNGDDVTMVSEDGQVTTRGLDGDEKRPPLCLSSIPVRIVFSEDGSHIATTAAGGRLNVWDNDGRLIASGRPRGWYGEKFAGGESDIELFEYFSLSQNSERLAFSGSGRFDKVAIADLKGFDTGRILHPSSLELFVARETPVNIPTTTQPRAALAATITDDHVIQIRDTSNNLISILQTTSSMPVSVTVSPDATRVVVASEDRFVHFYDATTWRETARVPVSLENLQRISFSPDGTRLILQAENGDTEIWDTRPYESRQADRDRVFAERKRVQGYVRDLLATDTATEELAQTVNADTTLTPLRKLVVLDELDWHAKRINDEANAKTESLFNDCLSLKRMLDAAAKEPDARVRERLVSLIKETRSSTHINGGVWKIVHLPGQPAERYQIAVEAADEMLEHHPTMSFDLNTIGLAYYRAGRYERAIELHRQAIAANGGGTHYNIASDWAIIAMSQWKLGRFVDAKSSLAVAVAAAQGGEKSEDIAALVAEAVAMIDPASTQPSTAPATQP